MVGAGLGAIGMASNINNIILATNRPPQARGNSGGSVECAMRTKDFHFRQMQVAPEYAKIIDDFFDVYGYATQRVKVPNICDTTASKRPHWNYVKTKDCTIVGSIPADDMKRICELYDNGITFWTNGAEVGNYSLDNSVSSAKTKGVTEIEPKSIEEVFSVTTE